MDRDGGGTKEVRFTVPGEPFGKQRPRVVRSGNHSVAYTPKETASYEGRVKSAYLQAAKGGRFGDGDMLHVRIGAYYSMPKSASKKRQRLMLAHKIRPTKKPDFDNIAKAICDSLNKVAYRDDSQIVEARVDKFFSESPRVDVLIRVLEP